VLKSYRIEKQNKQKENKMTNLFLNIKSGFITINTYRVCDAVLTDVNDILTSDVESQTLTASINNLDELISTLNVVRVDGIDMSGLPKFGEEPSDTDGIFSWDDDYGMMQDVNGSFYKEMISEN